MTSIHGYAITNLLFDYTAVTSHADGRKLFFQHLKSEFNTEPLEFCNAVLELKHTKNESDAVAKAYEICATFIAKEQGHVVPKQINLSAKSVESIVTALQQNGDTKVWKNTQHVKTVQELYDKLLDIVTLELASESFPRFVRSKLWLDYLKKNDVKLLQAMSVPRQASKVAYTDADFVDMVVTDQDFAFMEGVAKDSFDWEVQGVFKAKQSTITGYFSYLKYFPQCNWAKQGSLFKFVATLPYPIDLIAEARYPCTIVAATDANAHTVHQLHYIDNAALKQKYPNQVTSNYRDCGVLCYDLKFPFPMTTMRRYPAATAIEYYPDREEYVQLLKHCQPPDFKLKKKELYFCDFQLVLLRKIDEERTLFIELHCFDANGWGTSQKLQQLIVSNRARDMQKNMLSLLDKFQKGIIPKAPESDFGLRTLRACNVYVFVACNNLLCRANRRKK